jgi:hypothetical protein
VRTVGVETIVKRVGGVSYVLYVGFEGTNRGYLTQSYSSEQHNYALTDEGLQMHVVWRGASYFGDRGGSTGGQAWSQRSLEFYILHIGPCMMCRDDHHHQEPREDGLGGRTMAVACEGLPFRETGLFLAPQLVKAAVEGRLPRGIAGGAGLTRKGNFEARDRAANTAESTYASLSRDNKPRDNAREWRAFRAASGNLWLRENAWWT